MSLGKTLIDVCQLLEKHQVEYLLVGGTAVALHGYFRHSVTLSGEIIDKPDIDVWYNPTYGNYIKMLSVIESLGLNVDTYKSELEFDPRRSFFKLDFDDFTFDLLPMIMADIKFNEAFRRKEVVKTGDINIYFLNFDDLIKDKQTSARKKDIDDLKHLDRLKGS